MLQSHERPDELRGAGDQGLLLRPSGQRERQRRAQTRVGDRAAAGGPRRVMLCGWLLCAPEDGPADGYAPWFAVSD